MDDVDLKPTPTFARHLFVTMGWVRHTVASDIPITVLLIIGLANILIQTMADIDNCYDVYVLLNLYMLHAILQ